MKFLVRHLEQAAVFILMLIFEGIFWPPSDYFSTNPNLPLPVTDPYSTIFNALLIAFLAVAGFAQMRRMTPLVRMAWPLVPLIVLAYVSANWSIAPEIVAVRATKIAATAAFGLYLIGRGDLRGLISLLVKVNLVAVAASFLVLLVDPKLGISTNVEYAHAWRGAFTDKNELGMAASFGIIFAVHAFRNGYGPRLLSGIALPANALLLYFSDSITAVLILPIALYIAVLGGALGRRSSGGLVLAFGLIVAGLIGAAAVAGQFDELLALVGRNPTLSNRTRIWEVILPYIARRPWFGYGLESFWLPQSIPANDVWAILQWHTPHSHNMWLEFSLSLGLVGAAFGALLWVSAFWRAGRVIVGGESSDASFGLVLLVAIFLDNMTEFAFFRGDDMQWLLFCAVFLYLGREAVARTRSAVRAAPLVASPLAAAAPTFRAAQ